MRLFTSVSSEWKEFPDTGLQYNNIAQNQSSSWAVGSLYIFVYKQLWLVSLLKWNPWKLQLQLWKCMRSLESLRDFIHLPLTRQQVVCEGPTSYAYVYAMHSHGNRFLIFFQGLNFSFLLQRSWSFNRSKRFLWIFYSLKFEIQSTDFWKQFAFSPRGGMAGQLQTVVEVRYSWHEKEGQTLKSPSSLTTGARKEYKVQFLYREKLLGEHVPFYPTI